MSKAQVSVVKCSSYEPGEVERAVSRSVELLGGIEKFVAPGARVLIKPNLLSARVPEEGVNTHPEVLRAVARLVRQRTPHIFVGDSPGGWALRDIDEVYEKSGVKRVCDEEGLRLVKFAKAVSIGGFPITSIAREVDLIISIPKFKTHAVTILTGAVKNMFGMVVGLHKAHCHLAAPMPHELSGVLVKVFGLVKPALSVVDGVIGMEGEGPAAGDVRHIGLIAAGADAVALDAVLAALAGVAPHKVPTTIEAAKRGEGIADLGRIEVLGETIAAAKIKDFKLPKASYIFNLPRPLVRFATRNIKFYPSIDADKCKRCGLCFTACVKGAIKKLETRGGFAVNEKECIRCFCCYEACPYRAIFLKKSLLARIIMR